MRQAIYRITINHFYHLQEVHHRMSMRHEENDIYIIPPNFIDTGTVFGGTIKLRNAAEALAVSLLIGQIGRAHV